MERKVKGKLGCSFIPADCYTALWRLERWVDHRESFEGALDSSELWGFSYDVDESGSELADVEREILWQHYRVRDFHIRCPMCGGIPGLWDQCVCLEDT